MAISKPPNLQASPNRGRDHYRAPGHPASHPLNPSAFHRGTPSQRSGSAPPILRLLLAQCGTMPPPLCTTSAPAPDEAFPAAAASANFGKKGRERLEDNTEGGGSHFSCSFPSPSDSVASLSSDETDSRERPRPTPFAPDPFPSPGRAASKLHYHVDLVSSLHISDRLACGVIKARLTQRTNKLCGLKPEPANGPLRGCCSRQTSTGAASKPAVSHGHGTVYRWLQDKALS